MTLLRWLGRALAALACGVLLVAGVILGLALVGICVTFGALAELVDAGGLIVQTRASRPRRQWAPPAMTYQRGKLTADAPRVNTSTH